MHDDVSVSQRITSALVDHLLGIVEACGASAVFIYVDALECEQLSLPEALREKVFYVSRAVSEPQEEKIGGQRTVRVPNVNLTRLGQVKIAVFLTWSQGIVGRGDVIVCVTGVSDSGMLDTLVITEVGRESEVLATRGEESLPPGILPQVVERVIDIAAELGSEGREGKPVGALFVVGDAENVVRLSKQLIINPFKGYPTEERNVLDPQMEETTKELSIIDGAFIIDGDGVLVTCGALLRTSLQEQILPQGLGARHHAAAGITAVTGAIAITVSESTGTVTVFRSGRIVTEIEKPRSQRRRDL